VNIFYVIYIQDVLDIRKACFCFFQKRKRYSRVQ